MAAVPEAGRDVLGIVDRPHLPAPGSTARENYKEWYHFNVLDPAQGLDVLVNLSLAGDVTRAGAARADMIAFCHRARQGWLGGIDGYDAAAAVLAPERMDVALGHNSLRYEAGVYRLSVQLRDEPFVLEATLLPQSRPLLIWNDTPVGSGSVNWLIIPALQASGRLAAGGTTSLFSGVTAYHDHNWGRWKWGEDFGWDWGFAADRPDAESEARTTIVIDRTADRLGTAVMEQTLAVWRGPDLRALFTRRTIRARRSGRFTGQVPKWPGAAWLIDAGEVQTVPAHYAISARDGSNWLDVDYLVEAALQLSVPSDFGFGLIGLNETFGTLTAEGEVCGEAIGFSARASFEFLG
jgi:hypothetical protein